MMNALFLITLPAILVGCANLPKEADLQKADVQEEIVLTEPISTVSYRGLNYRWEEGALPGAYKAKLKDANGVYFYGEGRPIWMTNEALQKKPLLHIGGIYIPNDRSKSPQFFYLFEKTKQTTDNINDYIQNRMIMTETVPGIKSASGSPSLGVNVVGNVLGGAIVEAIIDSGVGEVTKYPPIESLEAKRKIIDSIRKIKTLSESQAN